MIEHSKSSHEGFDIHTLSNERLSLSIVPKLGGRIVSIFDKVAGKEWLDGWEMEGGRRLWEPADRENYETGPGAGIDECLPTVLPCKLAGKSLPDHGELWRMPTTLEADGLSSGSFDCSWMLQSLPLKFSRKVSFSGAAIRFAYSLKNLESKSTPFQWAWHPLFAFVPGDEMRFAEKIGRCFSPDGAEQSWPEVLPGQDLTKGELANADPSCAKVFVGPLSDSTVAICSGKSVLRMKWDTTQFPWAGIWINGGAWKGLSHWAIEPTNMPYDRLSDGDLDSDLSKLAPEETRKWEVTVSIETAT